jgi:hypothetical protein
LEEKLAFVQRQLEEKDKQLEHYKGLVKTMQELLDNRNASPKGPVPPGFKGKNISLFIFTNIYFKNLLLLKASAFLQDLINKINLLSKDEKFTLFMSILLALVLRMSFTKVRIFKLDYSDNVLVIEEDDDYGEYERELHRRQLEYEAELTESLRASPGQLKKSKSHQSLSHISSSGSEERFVPPHMR